MQSVTVIGAGLAGCECAYQLSKRGIKVTLCEMKPEKRSPAHISDNFAELVCSNSLRGADLSNAVGLLKEEMRKLDSLIISCADKNRVPAGGALAVDREKFSAMVTKRVSEDPNIEIKYGEITEIPSGEVVIATGPLTSDKLSDAIAELIGNGAYLSFFDAAAPIVTAESLDYNHIYAASRYGKGDADDYLNCPLSREEYTAFRSALCSAEEARLHGFEDSSVFEGCMPVEVMARRGEDALRFGPMKPVGLRDPRTGSVPYAVVQLRREDAAGTTYNIVGFQTHLKFGEQKRVFGMIPALKNAEYTRYGVMHRNTFLDSPKLLDRYYRLRTRPRISFAGQITGVEGYVESAASGMLVGIETARRLQGKSALDFRGETAIGALALYVSQSASGNFQPMNINFGIILPLAEKVRGKREKNMLISLRSLGIIHQTMQKERNL